MEYNPYYLGAVFILMLCLAFGAACLIVALIKLLFGGKR